MGGISVALIFCHFRLLKQFQRAMQARRFQRSSARTLNPLKHLIAKQTEKRARNLARLGKKSEIFSGFRLPRLIGEEERLILTKLYSMLTNTLQSTQRH